MTAALLDLRYIKVLLWRSRSAGITPIDAPFRAAEQLSFVQQSPPNASNRSSKGSRGSNTISSTILASNRLNGFAGNRTSMKAMNDVVSSRLVTRSVLAKIAPEDIRRSDMTVFG
ncbi:hypothetical protein [Bradyrhizobium retamae]|uniref:hypothetical protein n=1 Tax=Bradyrhizobium retamae TaxID=1300035 RepID=UPI0012E367F2|nr:hypothetical protein [Bradyrhizobium retamae]